MEIKLEKETLITSKTDLKGCITYANYDFIKYAGYTLEQLIGKPHNMVRHEDMPKTVFKYLWDYIKEGKEIFAFVKNKSKNGDFYWVFANATPSKNISGEIVGYYSVRRKPNELAIKNIEELYSKLLEIEKKEGLNAACAQLQGFCDEKQKSYNELIFALQHLQE